MKFVQRYRKNGYILIAPILLWNLLRYTKLPAAYQPATFNDNIPSLIEGGEFFFRILVFVLPALLTINFSKRKGMIIFIIGTIVYFLSWLGLIFLPDSGRSQSAIGFTAPAYTPIIWLIGFALVADKYYFNKPYKKRHFIVPSILMIGFHFSHALLVFLSLKP